MSELKAKKPIIHFLCCHNDMKPFFVLKLLCENNFFDNYDVVILSDADNGRVIDFCRENQISFYLYDEYFTASECDGKYELLVSVGWNKIIKNQVLERFNHSINCHGGYLPDYRGPSAYMAAYANIEECYGVTIHYMTEKIDDGKILKQAKLKLFLEETPQIIHYRMCELTAMILPESIQMALNNDVGFEQKGEARYFYSMSREEMQNLRNSNIERLRERKELVVAKHKKWQIEQ